MACDLRICKDHYLVIDFKRTQVSESVVFWRADGAGYTVDYNDAGHYTAAETADIDSVDNFFLPPEAIPAAALTTVVQKSMLVTARLLAKALATSRETE